MRRSKKAALVAVTLLLAAGVTAGIRLAAPRDGLALAGQVYVGKSPTAHPAVRVRASAWCGADTAATDRTPDLASGRQVHVVYAIPADGTDRFSTLAPAIVADLESLDGWWRAQDASRTIRFDLFAFPGCTPGLGQLDITRFVLRQPASFYAGVNSRAARLISEIGSVLGDPSKKYLLYFDGAVEEPRLCGQSPIAPNEGGPFAYSLIYTQACRADVGSGGITASVAAHELGHNLGAVQFGAPHGCNGDRAHICDDVNDLMYPYTSGQGLNAIALDVGHDDYYGHSGDWWDLQDSPWLTHAGPQFALTVTVGGTGTGTVTGSEAGISCPSTCSATLDQGAKVELTALPDAGTRFAGWSGGCTADPCVVTMTAAQTVVARFAAQEQVTVAVRKVGKAAGTVTSRPLGIVCPGRCTASFDQGTRVQLVATAAKNSSFTGWGGACSGKASCAVTAGTASAVTATFAVAQAFVPPKVKCKPGQRPTKKKPCRR